MELVVEVTSSDPRRPLSALPRLPLGLDIWEVRPDRVVLRAAEAQVDRLTKMGYRVQQLVDVSAHLSAFATADALAGYHSAASLEDDLKQLAASRPEIAELKEIGRSLEGRPIWALRIGERQGGKPKVLFMGCHHAREWIAVEVPFLLARELVEHADDPRVSRWLGSGEVWVAPMVNPDGHEFSRTQNRFWRKNRRPNPDGSFGVDPNRNYG
jgi:carboxypeptidase T